MLIFTTLGEITDAKKGTNPQHFGIRLTSAFESRITFGGGLRSQISLVYIFAVARSGVLQ